MSSSLVPYCSLRHLYTASMSAYVLDSVGCFMRGENKKKSQNKEERDIRQKNILGSEIISLVELLRKKNSKQLTVHLVGGTGPARVQRPPYLAGGLPVARIIIAATSTKIK